MSINRPFPGTLAVLAPLLLVIQTDPALAYIDSSSVWMGVQAVVAVLAGGVVALKLYWSQFRDRVRRLFGRQNGVEEGEDKVDKG
jgi:hypothetical protein